jgi:hypothetical protein
LNGQGIVLIGGTSCFAFATTEAVVREGAAIIVASSSKAKVLPTEAIGSLPMTSTLRSAREISSMPNADQESLNDYGHRARTADFMQQSIQQRGEALRTISGGFTGPWSPGERPL